MQIYKDALNAIDAGQVQAVNETSTPSAFTIRELIGAGFVEAKNGSDDDGLYYAEPVLTYKGRMHLQTL